MVKFLTSWGALLLGAIGTFLGVRSELRSRREHGWKREEHEREEAQREEEAARARWCDEQRAKLLAGQSVRVPPEKMQWAMWGEQQRYFKAVPHPLGTEVVLVLWTGR